MLFSVSLFSFSGREELLWGLYIVVFLQFGRAIVCSDAAAEAARYGFTAVDRPEGFLVLAVASLGEEIQEFSSPPEVL